MSSLTAGLLLLAVPLDIGRLAPEVNPGARASGAHATAWLRPRTPVRVPASAPAVRVRRGPIESRDEFLLAQARLTLPAVAPDAPPRGRTRVRVAGDWGNDFGFRQGLVAGVRRLLYFVDGEHRSGSLQVSRGVTDRWTMHARLPVLWRGGGVLDGFIDAWHRLTGLPDSNRPDFARDQLSVRALDHTRNQVRWTARQGAGLGGLELGARWCSPSQASGWTGAVDGRVQLPTGTAGFGGGGVQLGAQAVAARTLGAAADLYLGAGGTAASQSEQDDISYAAVRPHGFVALEWRPWRPVSVIAEATAAGRLVRNVDGFPALHLMLRVGTKVDVRRGWRVEAGFTEGLRPIAATTDFGLMVGLEKTF